MAGAKLIEQLFKQNNDALLSTLWQSLILKEKNFQRYKREQLKPFFQIANPKAWPGT